VGKQQKKSKKKVPQASKQAKKQKRAWRRKAIKENAGQGCPACKKKFDNGQHMATVDHIIPRSMGGADAPHNYQLLCFQCNLDKGNKMPWDMNFPNAKKGWGL
jgi:5-methylcytosine-specific restriction endonuclease McrA